ncbi:hypothetical protein [Hymenobacter citatus]|uniref:hypothetical protein n=1 Tax=Hymenobacter citatus TaxID=2763506 RepID=UPI00165163AC|nr:hypothetical protein [Hymenobacter citatus]
MAYWFTTAYAPTQKAPSEVTVRASPPASAPAPAAADSAAGCHPLPLRFVSSPALRRPMEVHRYVGTVGGHPATAVLQWVNPDSIEGSFYLHQGGPAYSLYLSSKSAGPMVLQVYDDQAAQRDRGVWRLTGRLGGTALTGFWQDTSQRQAIQLHESYEGAVRYSIETMLLIGGTPDTGDPATDSVSCIVPKFQQYFLTLLEPAAIHPTLRSVLTSPVAARRQQMLDAQEPDADVNVWLDVRLNDFGLFSYQTIYAASPFGGRLQYGVESTLVDLTTGKALSVASQLQPNYELPLRRLLSQHLLQDPAFDEVNNTDTTDTEQQDFGEWAWHDAEENPSLLVSLPDLKEPSADDLTLTAVGVEATYSPFGLFKSPGGKLPSYSVVIPYQELRPLVRPGTALARMLAARGL